MQDAPFCPEGAGAVWGSGANCQKPVHHSLKRIAKEQGRCYNMPSLP